MKSFNLLLLLSGIYVSPAIATVCYTVDDAAKKGLIKYSFKSKGGYTGNVMELSVQNLSDGKLDLMIDAGRRLDSKKEEEQDILVTKSQEFFVNAKQKKTISVFGMCCQAHNSSPTKGNTYGIGAPAAPLLRKLAHFIDSTGSFENYTAQEAVWTVSDNNSIASIEGDDTTMVDKFKKYVSSITGRPIPKYSVTYKGDGNDVGGRATKIEGVFNYTVNQNGHITIGIYDESGKLVQLFFQDITHARGECKLYYTFNTKDLPTGTYYARMSNDGMVEKQEKIEF